MPLSIGAGRAISLCYVNDGGRGDGRVGRRVGPHHIRAQRGYELSDFVVQSVDDLMAPPVWPPLGPMDTHFFSPAYVAKVGSPWCDHSRHTWRGSNQWTSRLVCEHCSMTWRWVKRAYLNADD